MPPAAPQPRTADTGAPSASQRARHDAAAEERRRSFLRMVSHELRTPLNSILGFSELLSQEIYGPLGAPQYKEYAEIISGSGKKLLKLVNQVLEIARLESQAVAWDLRPEPLDGALEEVVASLRDELSAHHIRVTLIEAAAMPAVMADPRGLRTVLAALLQNAAIFSPEGGEVRVRARTRGRSVDILIEDDGAGVDPADIPRLLRPFEQGENALVRRGEGAGLGLSISELTCRAMGGRLKLISEPGRGMTARVQLRGA